MPADDEQVGEVDEEGHLKGVAEVGVGGGAHDEVAGQATSGGRERGVRLRRLVRHHDRAGPQGAKLRLRAADGPVQRAAVRGSRIFARWAKTTRLPV